MHGHVKLIPVNPIKERGITVSQTGRAIEAFQASSGKKWHQRDGPPGRWDATSTGARGQLGKTSLEEEGKGESDHGGMRTDRHRTEAEHGPGFYLCLTKAHRILENLFHCGGRHGEDNFRLGFRFRFVVENLVRFL